MNQLSFTYIDEKEIRPFVIEELKKYKVLRVRFQNQRERLEIGADILFPELRKIDVHELKYRQLHRAFEHALDQRRTTNIGNEVYERNRVKR